MKSFYGPGADQIGLSAVKVKNPDPKHWRKVSYVPRYPSSVRGRQLLSSVGWDEGNSSLAARQGSRGWLHLSTRVGRKGDTAAVQGNSLNRGGGGVG